MTDETIGPPPRFDLTDMRVLRETMRRHEIEARKEFSQHWLVDRDALDTITTAAELTRDDTVVEVGAGMGVLTVELARRAGRVVAIEVERDVLRSLRDMVKPYGNVEIIHEDLLKLNPSELMEGTDYKVVANLPYSITGLALRVFLEAAHPPRRMVVLIQKEVAERLVAKPGDLSLIGLSAQFYSTPRIVAIVPASSFSPPPKVDSAIVALDWHEPPTDAETRARMFVFAKIAFSQRRKQLHNILPSGLYLSATQVASWLEVAGITPDRRPQTLSVDEWVRLAQTDPRVQKSDAS